MTSRVRTNGELTHLAQVFTETRANGTVATTLNQDEVNLLQIGEFTKTTDVVTPNFHARQARGEIINNPFHTYTVAHEPHFSGVTIVNNVATGTQIKTSNWSYVYGSPSYSPNFWVDGDALWRSCATEVAAKVAETNVDGAIEAGEARETMNLFHKRQWSLREHVERELRYANKRGMSSPIRVPVSVMANNWLKYRYGIGPLLALLNDAIVVGAKIQTRRETARDGGVTGGSSAESFTLQGGLLRTDYSAVHNWSFAVRAGILYEYMNFRNKYGLSLDQIPSVAWELLPWSFVSDWVWNMGTFIRALTPKSGIRRLATWIGYNQTSDVQITLSGYSKVMASPSNWTVSRPPGGSTTIRMEAKRRVPGLPVPSLYIRENALSEIVTSERIVDAFALTSQLFYRLMRTSRP